jgi:hypothetical protein
VIFFLAFVCILRRVFEQLVNSRAVTMLRYTRCNIVILIAATAWPMLSFSSCIVCGLPYFSLGTLVKYGIRIKSAHDTGTEGQHQPRSCSHQNHNVHRVYLNMIRRVQLCTDAGVNHFATSAVMVYPFSTWLPY